MHSRDRVLASETGFQMHPQLQCSKVRLKVRFHKPCTFAASVKQFDHANRILYPKVDVLVYTVSRLTVGRPLILWSLRCCKIDREINCTTFLSLDTQDVEKGQLRCTETFAVFNRT